MTGSVNPRTAAAGARKVMREIPQPYDWSCQQADAAQGELHHLVDGLVGRQSREAQPASVGGALDLFRSLLERVQVGALGERRRGELAFDAGLRVTQSRVTGPVRRQLL